MPDAAPGNAVGSGPTCETIGADTFADELCEKFSSAVMGDVAADRTRPDGVRDKAREVGLIADEGLSRNLAPDRTAYYRCRQGSETLAVASVSRMPKGLKIETIVGSPTAGGGPGTRLLERIKADAAKGAPGGAPLTAAPGSDRSRSWFKANGFVEGKRGEVVFRGAG